MSGYLIACVACEWQITVDDPFDGADKADAHADVCDGPQGPSPFPEDAA